MAVRTREELIQNLQTILGDNTTDEALSLIEDATDTLSDLETRSSGESNWQKKYEENDAMWRKKYRDRFFNPQQKDDDEDEGEDDKPKPKTFADLFK